MRASDLKSARASFSVAHAHYARLAPIAVFFPDLDGDVDSGARADPASSGFRQLEWDLYASPAPRDMGAIADKLVADVVAMQARFEDLPLTPAPTIVGAVEAIGGLAPEAIGSAGDGHAGAYLSDARADVEGVRKIVDLFRPLTAKSDRILSRALDDGFAELEAKLARYRSNDGALEPAAGPSREERATMQSIMRKLSSELSQLPAALGLGLRERRQSVKPPSHKDDDSSRAPPQSPSRRRLLLGLGAVAGGLNAGVALGAPAATEIAEPDPGSARQPFYGAHQSGVTTPRQPAGLVVSFTVLGTTRNDLERLLRKLTERIAFLTEGGPAPVIDPKFPAPDSGLLGPVVTPGNLTMTVGARRVDFRRPLRLGAAQARASRADAAVSE